MTLLVKTRVLTVAVVAVAATVGLMPAASADPDPHIPDGNANWCPGGDHREAISGGGRYCLGIPFADGTFYAQSWGHSTSPFGPGYWSGSPDCSQWIEGQVQWAVPGHGVCGGGPMHVNH